MVQEDKHHGLLHEAQPFVPVLLPRPWPSKGLVLLEEGDLKVVKWQENEAVEEKADPDIRRH